MISDLSVEKRFRDIMVEIERFKSGLLLVWSYVLCNANVVVGYDRKRSGLCF